MSQFTPGKHCVVIEGEASDSEEEFPNDERRCQLIDGGGNVSSQSEGQISLIKPSVPSKGLNQKLVESNIELRRNILSKVQLPLAKNASDIFKLEAHLMPKTTSLAKNSAQLLAQSKQNVDNICKVLANIKTFSQRLKSRDRTS